MECVRGSLGNVLMGMMMVVAIARAWDADWQPRSIVRLDDHDLAMGASKLSSHHHPMRLSSKRGRSETIRRFEGRQSERDDFRLLLAEDTTMLLAARNTIYNISMITLKKNAEIEWKPDQSHIDVCQMRQKSLDECQNYIRVLVKKSRDTLYACGTNAFRPTCRSYIQQENGEYRKSDQSDDPGMARCPFDPSHNTTAIYTDGKLYTATVADFSSRDPLILDTQEMIRTEQFDSKMLNEPNFVSSFEKDDKVFFFFRETAVENINCGKAVFSRVGRVCKKDTGGNQFLLTNTFTSFFKARLNCSVPGNFPFYFDEIQSTTEMGKGNYRPTFDSGDRTDMVYAVFKSPENSILGSAVCAFRYSDIMRSFEGRFKGQKSVWHNWLTVPWEDTPKPHPQECMNSSGRELQDSTLNFIKTHPLMNTAVPASGGAPLLIHASFKAQFTKIAIDWQVHAADERYYDVMFVGTNDGRVIKAVNKGPSSKIETLVIEDIRVFGEREPISDLKVYRNKGEAKLIVVSTDNVVSIPLHRCHERKTCRTCVELRDPYCAWEGTRCINTEKGIQNVIEGWKSGWQSDCEEVTIYDETEADDQPDSASPEKEQCACPSGSPTIVEEDMDSLLIIKGDNSMHDNFGGKGDRRRDGTRVGQSSEEAADMPRASTSAASVETLAIAIVVSIVLSLLLGFFIGYKVASCRLNHNSEASYLERTCSLQRSRNRLSSGEHPYFNPDHGMMPKTMNYVVNVKGKLNTGSVETKPVTKSNKVYL